MELQFAICLICALVAVSNCQDLTSFVYQALGIEPPLLPPVMPQNVREHFYPHYRQQQLLEQQRQQQQKQRYLNYLTAQQQRQQKENPYSTSYVSRGPQPRDNSVYSSANSIRTPGSPNTVSKGGNPYNRGSATGATGSRGGRGSNPYGVSRSSSLSVAARNRAPVPIPPQATRIMQSMQQMTNARDQPRKAADAKSAGCAYPSESTAVSMMMYSDCKSPAAQMICQAEMMTCVTVGMSAMCCPYGVNNLALDTVGYVNKLQHFLSEFA